MLWVNQCSFVFLWSICSSRGIWFALPTFSLFISTYIPCSIFSTHHSCTSHQQFDIIPFFSFIIDIFILDSFFIIDIFILDILRSMVYDTLCIYCILYTRVWGFIIEIIESSFLSFLHLIILAYVMSRVLRPPWGTTSHIVFNNSHVCGTWDWLERILIVIDQELWYDPTLGHSHFREFFYHVCSHSTWYIALRHAFLGQGWFF